MTPLAGLVMLALLGYLVLHAVIRLGLFALAASAVAMHQQRSSISGGLRHATGFEPPVTLIVPAGANPETALMMVRLAHALQYPQTEVVVVHDRPDDASLQALSRAFGLQPFPEPYRMNIATQPVRAIYSSIRMPQLRVIDKEPGGWADAVNAGINAARLPLVCVLDASIALAPDVLLRLVQPFMYDERIVASASTLRAANDCEIRDGLIVQAALPKSWLPLMQVLEALREHLAHRLGWSRVNGVLALPGALSLVRREALVAAGGSQTDEPGDDPVLPARLRRLAEEAEEAPRIAVIPETVAWTRVPEKLSAYCNGRRRHHAALFRGLWRSFGPLFSAPGAAGARVAWTLEVLFVGLAPLVELAGYVAVPALVLAGDLDAGTAALFAMVALLTAMLISALALLLGELGYHIYPGARRIRRLIAAVALEHFGYRQIDMLCRIRGMFGG